MPTKPPTRPKNGATYYAPCSLASNRPLLFGQFHGVIVDDPSQGAAVVYTTREAADQALADRDQWAEQNVGQARVSRLIFDGGWFRFADQAEAVAHRAAADQARAAATGADAR
ncbi:hypothetical protein IT072_20920 (plasmid) [Leifsonia sp. ZF2019]|uniref:hypothetical protein n=1 Tax=Leifsonia sp. ZF2019 TaxID=2781978 RepID=UPI001CBF5B1A|nr:hypothetical protein [Leifsonia sp. ZF2019]UAJ81723.1 hypothetical protein IT072_20920 [Leifsonia sp. ZF2019]